MTSCQIRLTSVARLQTSVVMIASWLTILVSATNAVALSVDVGPRPSAEAARSEGGPWQPAVEAHLIAVVDIRTPVASDELDLAIMHVSRIFGAIDVRIDWLDTQTLGVPPSPKPHDGIHQCVVRVEITRSKQPVLANEGLLGMATHDGFDDGGRVLLYLDEVERAAGAHQRSRALVMAAVVAHDIGHLLLPAPAHTTVGVMQTPWDAYTMEQAAQHALRFTPRQGELIRQWLGCCCVGAATRSR